MKHPGLCSRTAKNSVMTRVVSCVDGPRLARDHLACRTEVACSHVSGLFTQSGGTAGPDGVREPRPHHSSGIDVPMKRQASLGCVGSTDCAKSNPIVVTSPMDGSHSLLIRSQQFGTQMPQGGHPPHHSITSSASESELSEIVTPSDLAVLRLITVSNLVGCSTGRSAGFAPLRICPA